MKIIRRSLMILVGLSYQPVFAGDLTTDAAIGGAIGGALGGAIGAEVGGRNGAIVGGGVGAALGTTIATDGHDEANHRKRDEKADVIVRERVIITDRIHGHPHARHCPPGQAKKGRC